MSLGPAPGSQVGPQRRVAAANGQPPADRVPAYLEKYRQGIARIGMTPDRFARAYSVAIRLAPGRLDGH